MKTNKLGLEIDRINEGLKKLLIINDDQEWTKYVRDIRKELENIENISSSSVVLMLTGIPTGFLITAATVIGGRKNDSIAAWIYVPSHVNVKGTDLVGVINDVTSELLAPFRDDDRLRRLFDKEYTSVSVDNITFISNGDKWGYRYYGQGVRYSLSDLLDEIGQSYYKKYKSIFLLDKSSGMQCLLGEDLTTRNLESAVVVFNPNKHRGFIPYINDVIVDRPLRFVIGDRVAITWKQNGYRTITTETKITENTSWNYPSESDIMREFFPNEIINIVDERGKRVEGYYLKINGQQYLDGAILYLRNNEVKVKLEISADGFEPLQKDFDFDRPYPVTLKRKLHRYTFILPYRIGQVKGTSVIELPLNEKLEECPFKGYTTRNGYVSSTSDNYLIYNPKKKRSVILIFLISTLVSLLIGCCGGIYLGCRVMNDKLEKVEKENNQLKEDKKKEQEKAEQEKIRKEEERKSAIRKYLDENNVWNRSKMEAYPEIAGLWDALNERDFDKILTYKDYLKNSERFRKVIEAVEKNKDKKFKGKHTTKDNDITIEGYIKALNDAPPSNSDKTVSAKKIDKKQESEKGNDGWF